MTGTSRALKRLGVTGLSAAIATIGLVPLAATNAFAIAPAPTQHVALDKHSDSASVGTCNAFTATIDPNSTVTVQIQQNLGQSSVATHQIGFCTPSNPSANDSVPTTALTKTPGTPGNNSDSATSAGNCQTIASPQPPPANTSTTYSVSCYAQFTDTGAPGDGKVVFGVRSTDTGTMNIDAFGDTNTATGTTGVHDQGEPGDQAVKTWVATDKTARTDKISCLPLTATNPTNSEHVFNCTVTDANGVAIPGADNVHFIVTNGPDVNTTGVSGAPGGPGTPSCTDTGNNSASANPAAPAFPPTGNQAGVVTCRYTNNGSTGTDDITVYLEQNNQSGLQVNDPETQTVIHKTWVSSANQNATISVTCSPNQTQAPAAGNGFSSQCQLPLTQKTSTITATVTHGTNPVTPDVGVIVTWTEADQAGGDANDTETLSATSCTTDNTGKCSVTLTDSVPTEGEDLQVTGTTTRQSVGPVSATADIVYHNPTASEARNITVTPKSVPSAPSGGAQTFVAMVKDRFNNPVAGVCVGWTESGPGRFTNNALTACNYNLFNANNYQAACQTAADGTCSEEVTTLSSENGTETVTAQIDFNPNSPQDNFNAGGNNTECQAPAGQNFVTGSKTAPDTTSTPTAPAGNCTDSGTVTWTANGGGGGNGTVVITTATDNVPAGSPVTITGTAPANAAVTLNGFDWHNGNHVVGNATADAAGNWTFTTSAIFYNTTVTANVTGLAASNTKTVGVTQTFSGVHFNKIGVVRGFSEYNVDGVSSSYVPDEPIRVQNGACRSQLCGITHIRAVNGIAHFDRLHIYLKPGTYTFTLFGSGGSPATGHQYLNPGRMQFTVTIH